MEIKAWLKGHSLSDQFLFLRDAKKKKKAKMGRLKSKYRIDT